MITLITAQDVRDARPLASNVKDKRIEQFILEAQDIDLRQALNTCGKDFLQYILANTSDSDIQLLLTGGTYTYSSETYSFVGLNQVLALYSYARIVEGTQYTVTGHGVVKKQTDYGELATDGSINAIASKARTVASQYMGGVVTMLCRLSATYPQYGGISNAPKSFNITGVQRLRTNKNTLPNRYR